MQAVRVGVRTPVRQWRRFSLCSIYSQNAEAAQIKIDPVSIPPPSNVDRPLSPKIEKLVTEISQLSLIEVSELTSGLKKRLNLPDAPLMAAGFAAAGPAPLEEEEDSAPAKVKSSFTVKLMKFDEKQKVAIIKEVKALVEGMNLVQAKKFVEGAPAVVKADISKEEAEKLKAALTKVGGEVEID